MRTETCLHFAMFVCCFVYIFFVFGAICILSGYPFVTLFKRVTPPGPPPLPPPSMKGSVFNFMCCEVFNLITFLEAIVSLGVGFFSVSRSCFCNISKYYCICFTFLAIVRDGYSWPIFLLHVFSFIIKLRPSSTQLGTEFVIFPFNPASIHAYS